MIPTKSPKKVLQRKGSMRKPHKIVSSASKRKKARKVKRGKIQALWGSYGLKVPLYRRYSGRKGIYWWLLSKSCRERDYKEHNGECMTCELFVEKGDDQGGHFFPARNCGFDLLLHPLNVHLQHSWCNNPRITPQAGIYNSRTLTKRYGTDFIERLEMIKKRPNQKEWNQAEYNRRIKLLLENPLASLQGT